MCLRIYPHRARALPGAWALGTGAEGTGSRDQQTRLASQTSGRRAAGGVSGNAAGTRAAPGLLLRGTAPPIPDLAASLPPHPGISGSRRVGCAFRTPGCLVCLLVSRTTALNWRAARRIRLGGCVRDARPSRTVKVVARHHRVSASPPAGSDLDLAALQTVSLLLLATATSGSK